LFYPAFYKYYEKSPKVLCLQYIENPKSLTQDEKERLIWEAGGFKRDILELKINFDDPVLMAINSRLAIKHGKDPKLNLLI